MITFFLQFVKHLLKNNTLANYTNNNIVMLASIGLDSKKRTLPLNFFIKNKKHPAIVRQSTS